MVKEAETYKEQDDAYVQRIEAKNKLESYVYNIKSSVLGDDKLKEALGSDMETVETTVSETIKWLEEESNNKIAKDYEDKYKEVESILMPLVQKSISNS